MGAVDTWRRIPGNNMLYSFLNPGEAYKGAEDEANRSWKEAQGYETPYWQQGINQTGRLNEAENALLDPQALQDKWAKGYETSPYAKQQLAQNKTQGMDAASSMGLMGSSAAIGNIQQGAGNIVSKDRQQYMDDLMNKYMAGIGLGSNIYGIGANMGGKLGDQSLEHGRDVASLKYKENAAPGELFGKILGGAADVGANIYTGGAYGAAKGASRGFNQ